ncbi:MAG: pyridoxamine 5'-phosphate oxidase family protein [Gammaproteobacteria bacterium]|nr:pyridoxamine 5'-phosphate oxidase family protein [Gammaproteobacteria bacterium]
MADFYTPAQRQLQDEFDTRGLADRLVEAIITDELTAQQTAFIHSRNMFFLSTIDERGFPSASYKGGAPGFVRVPDTRSLVFPSYDGTGMFMSLGNIEAKTKVGLLFIDFETPQRMRVRGEARLLREGPMLAGYPGAKVAVEVSIERIWQNCPRYVHKMQPVEQSPYVPAADGSVQLALWKRIDMVQDVLSETDRAEARSIGLIDIAEYEARVARGELV